MTFFSLATNFVSDYSNSGQASQQWFAYTVTGERQKADNVPHDKGADVLHYQVKSARATVCKGTDIRAYLATDKATEYAYVTKNGIAYIMSRTEYIEFVEVFGTITRESSRNGGAEKIRLKSESTALLTYLEMRAH
jgi:hypothetical protein